MSVSHLIQDEAQLSKLHHQCTGPGPVSGMPQKMGVTMRADASQREVQLDPVSRGQAVV